MAKGMSESATLGKLAEALVKAQAQMGPAIKGAKNPFFKSTYAKLEHVIEAVREPFTENGLCYVQFIEEDGDGTYLVTKLMHMSGEWVSGRMKLIPAKKDMQAQGSAITYAKRFSLSAMAGLAEEDDDGAAASRQPDPPPGGTPPPVPLKPIAPKVPQLTVQPNERLTRISQLKGHLGWPDEQVRAQIKKINPNAILTTLTPDEYKILVAVMEGELLKGK